MHNCIKSKPETFFSDAMKNLDKKKYVALNSDYIEKYTFLFLKRYKNI